MQLSKNFFFDLDGVLVDACDWHYHSLNKALEKNNEEIIPYDLHVTTYNGLPTKVKLGMLKVVSTKFQNIVDDKNNFFNSIVESECFVDKEKVELMDFLKSKGILVSCVTNSIRYTAESILAKLGISKYFDLIVSNEEVKLNKPYPMPYDYAIEKLNCGDSINIAVEDSEKGIESASKSKINIVWKVKNSHEVNLFNYKSIFGE